MTKQTNVKLAEEVVELVTSMEEDTARLKIKLQNELRDLVCEQDQLRKRQQAVRTKRSRLTKILEEINNLEKSL